MNIIKNSMIIILISLPIISGSQEISPPLVIDISISPANYYTLISPYPGTVAVLGQPGSVTLPTPPHWPPAALTLSNIDYLKKYNGLIDKAKKLSLARLVREPQREMQDEIDSRLNFVQQELSRFGLKTYEGNIPPWSPEFSEPDQSWLIKKFYLAYMNPEAPELARTRISDAKNELERLRNNTPLSEDVRKIIAAIKVAEPVKISAATEREAISKVLVWIARGEIVSSNYVIKDPYNGDSFEPNSLDLVSDSGIISLVIPRQGRLDTSPQEINKSIAHLITYWRKIKADNLLDKNDVNFLNKIIQGQGSERSEAARLRVIDTIISESLAAGKELYKGIALGSIVNLIAIYEPSSDPATNEASIRKELKGSYPNNVLADDLIKKTSIALSLPVPGPVDPRNAPLIPLPIPSAFSIARLGNELRPAVEYHGSIINASERPGFITLRKDGKWYDFNLLLWTVSLPLGGDADNGDHTYTANRESNLLPRLRYDDLEEIFDIEVRAAIALSPSFVEVSRTFSFDMTAAALREFDYRKTEAGRAMRRAAEKIRGTQSRLAEAIYNKKVLDKSGFFFVLEPSVIVNNNVKVGSKVLAGTQIAVVRPIYRHQVDMRIEVGKIPRSFLVGAKFETNLKCDGSLPMPLLKENVGIADIRLKELYDKHLSSNKFGIEITAIDPIDSPQGKFYHIGGILTTLKPSQQVAIESKDAEDLGGAGKNLIRKDGQAFKMNAPLGILPPYANCSISL